MRTTIRVGTVTAVLTTALVATGCGSSQASPAPAAPAAPAAQTIANLFPEWNAALATGDPQRVADLYAPDAVLLPTVSNEVRKNRAEIVDYFTTFLKSKPQGTIDQETIDVLDADTAINTGVYDFELTKDGKVQHVKARYTYVYELYEGKWLIVNHHSSAMPES